MKETEVKETEVEDKSVNFSELMKKMIVLLPKTEQIKDKKVKKQLADDINSALDGGLVDGPVALINKIEKIINDNASP